MRFSEEDISRSIWDRSVLDSILGDAFFDERRIEAARGVSRIVEVLASLIDAAGRSSSSGLLPSALTSLVGIG